MSGLQTGAKDFALLAREHGALMQAYGRAQARCSELLREQALAIERLEAQAVRLRAAAIQRETALAWAREDRAALVRAMPGLPRRVILARRVDALLERIQHLMRERAQTALPVAPGAAVQAADIAPSPDDPERLEASLRAADLVICQVGCLSQGAYWRVQDHCRRTGKACVLVHSPDALRIVRIHKASDGTEQALLDDLRR